jgi:hypothetical protein
MIPRTGILVISTSASSMAIRTTSMPVERASRPPFLLVATGLPKTSPRQGARPSRTGTRVSGREQQRPGRVGIENWSPYRFRALRPVRRPGRIPRPLCSHPQGRYQHRLCHLRLRPGTPYPSLHQALLQAPHCHRSQSRPFNCCRSQGKSRPGLAKTGTARREGRCLDSIRGREPCKVPL